jgi:hypothetical protein
MYVTLLYLPLVHCTVIPRFANSLNTRDTLCTFCSRLIAGTLSSLDSVHWQVNTSIRRLHKTNKICEHNPETERLKFRLDNKSKVLIFKLIALTSVFLEPTSTCLIRAYDIQHSQAFLSIIQMKF